MLFFVQASNGSGLHYFHQRAAYFGFLLLFKRGVKLVKEARGNTLLLLHQFLGCVYVKGDAQQPERRLNAGKVIQFADGGATRKR